MIRRPPRSTPLYSSAASDVYKRQGLGEEGMHHRQPDWIREGLVETSTGMKCGRIRYPFQKTFYPSLFIKFIPDRVRKILEKIAAFSHRDCGFFLCHG